MKKFYFLEYFYVLLKSIEKYSNKIEIFNSFKELKHEFKLGESKYKKLTNEPKKPSKVQLDRYRYTFKQVIEESKEYELITETDDDNYLLTNVGISLLKLFEQNENQIFYEKLFSLIEIKNEPFKSILQFLYNANNHRKGLLVFPSYSPRQLGFEKKEIYTYGDYLKYLEKLKIKLEDDIYQYIGKKSDLSKPLNTLLSKLVDSDLFSKVYPEQFPHKTYNKVTKRVRDFWINYFLKDIYNFPYSYSTFEIWTYRAKQIGILNATDFYPNFYGRIIYPTSVISKANHSNDFKSLYKYTNGEQLFLHKPTDDKAEEKFVENLVKNYFHLKNQTKLYFVRLTSLRELVCYNMKISEISFEQLLNLIYQKNLSGLLRIKISLEVDKLPEDTKSMYLKRAPVMVDNKFRNIIAIDINKEGRLL